jgi:hypothetical protein
MRWFREVDKDLLLEALVDVYDGVPRPIVDADDDGMDDFAEVSLAEAANGLVEAFRCGGWAVKVQRCLSQKQGVSGWLVAGVDLVKGDQH